IARLFTLFALFPLVLSTIPMWLPSLIWIGAITAFIGGTLALYTTDIKGVGAYSTISQIGFMMATLGAAPSSSAVGWFAGLFHLTNHAFFQGLDFLAIGGIIHAVGSRDMRLMGGLRKAMPITFSFSMVVMLARTGIPPFSSFFSKELIIDSLSSAGSILLMVIIYATTALTFAYSLRFIVLVYLRDLSAYLKKIRIHEPSKIMLFSSGIVAIMCVCLVLFIDPFAKFMNAGFEMGLTQVFSPSTLLFAIVLFLGGLPVYLAYYRKSPLIEKIRKTVLGPVSTVLEHGYFFDDFYERVVANGIVRISEGIHNVEAVFELLPQLTARAITGLAYGAHKYFDVFADELLYIMANRALALGSRIGKTHNQSLQRYLVAALLGFLILLILVIATMWAMR
ncbi:MAG TPA: proton-conducting transporter membrane subunit, partial [Acidobacteriota bacterium]|nr:proton-conducting transporter membrane subunit [Acidobacteriota bacterium]